MSSQPFYSTLIELSGLKKNGVNRRVLEGGKEVVIVFTGEEIRVMANQCTHMGAPLADGILGNGTLQCPWHGYIYDLKTCEMACNPNLEPYAKILKLYKSYNPQKRPKYRLPILPHEVRDGKIYVKKTGAA